MTPLILTLPFAAQGALMAVDEFVFHTQRRLGRWERIGHPVDTAVFVSCLAVAGWAPYSQSFVLLYSAIAVLSCLIITKDEWVHTQVCTPMENWLHSLLFVVHPVALISSALLWQSFESPEGAMLKPYFRMFVASVVAYLLYQILYWNFFSQEARARAKP